MAQIFRPLKAVSSWRRFAPHVWQRPSDPTVYGVMEVVVDRALPYLDALSRQTGTKVRLTHLVTKALASAIESNPEANGIISRRRIHTRSSIDIFVQVATEGGRDLSGAKIERVDEKSIPEVARELTELAERVRRRADPGVERTKHLMERLPNSLIGWTVKALEILVYDLQLDLSRFGIARDQFGSAMVSNIGNFGSFGMNFALAPLVPVSRCPIVVLVGEVSPKPVVEGDRVVARPVLSLGCTFDHRMIDGAQASSMATIFKRGIEDPERVFGPSRGRGVDYGTPEPGLFPDRVAAS